jgi:predicted deacylase
MVLGAFAEVSQNLGLRVRRISGGRRGADLLLATHKEGTGASRLIIAGTHGDEPAGVFGLFHFLLKMQSTGRLKNAPPFAILPLISPTAFAKATRSNAWGEDANRGFSSAAKECKGEFERPSREGLTLLRNAKTLRSLSGDAVLSLHEDVDASQFYLYAYEKANAPSLASLALRDLGSQRFGLVPDSDFFEGSKVHQGIIQNDLNSGAFDEFLFLNGASRVFVTETPVKRPLAERVGVNTSLVRKFLSI